MIKKEDLVKDSWYLGSKRSRYLVAYWDGVEFISLSRKFDDVVTKHMNHWDDPEFGCFEPIQQIKEGE